jgi:uncharacterized membrane protein YcgQ (UPF0703/DUF1980 family)
MKKKKIIAIIFLGIILGAIIFGIILMNKHTNTPKTNSSNKETKTVLNSGATIPSKVADVVMSDNRFLTQLNDIYLNFDEYNGKTIEIEGFPMIDPQYTFIGRYSPGCPYCSGNYAYIEYKYDGKIDLTSEKDWIKIIGTLKKGNDGKTDYIYIQVSSIEKMATRGKDTVSY